MRCSSTREHDKLRKIRITRDFTKYAEGSVLVEFGAEKIGTLQDLILLCFEKCVL